VVLEYDYRSRQNLSFVVREPEEALFVEDGYGLLSVRFTLRAGAGGWALTAFVNNLLEEEYRTVGRIDSIGGAYEIFGPPRTFGFQARYEW